MMAIGCAGGGLRLLPITTPAADYRMIYLRLTQRGGWAINLSQVLLIKYHGHEQIFGRSK